MTGRTTSTGASSMRTAIWPMSPLRQVARIEADVQASEQAVRDAEARAAEWTGTASVDATLDYYNAVVDLIDGKVKEAHGAREVNVALASMIRGIWMAVANGRLRAEFQLLPLADRGTPNGLPQSMGLDWSDVRLISTPASRTGSRPPAPGSHNGAMNLPQPSVVDNLGAAAARSEP